MVELRQLLSSFNHMGKGFVPKVVQTMLELLNLDTFISDSITKTTLSDCISTP